MRTFKAFWKFRGFALFSNILFVHLFCLKWVLWECTYNYSEVEYWYWHSDISTCYSGYYVFFTSTLIVRWKDLSKEQCSRQVWKCDRAKLVLTVCWHCVLSVATQTYSKSSSKSKICNGKNSLLLSWLIQIIARCVIFSVYGGLHTSAYT